MPGDGRARRTLRLMVAPLLRSLIRAELTGATRPPIRRHWSARCSVASADHSHILHRESKLTRSIIYTVDGAGTLTAMRPSEPRSEDFMQKLVAAHPELIADEDGALLLIRREQPI